MKSFASFLLVLSFVQLHETFAGKCQFVYTDKWSVGGNGNFVINFPTSVSSWTAKISFTKAVNSLTVYSASKSQCSGNVCTVSNAGYNGNQVQGSSLTLDFGITFPGPEAPEVVSISINNQEACSGGGGGGPATTTPSTTTTTQNNGPTTTGSSPTSPPGGNQRGVFVPWPNKVLGMYLLLADDFTSFGSNANWKPELYPYQQKGSNVLFFSFVNPSTMAVPPAFQTLAKTRGTNQPGAVPANTVIIFAIGGIGYSQKYIPWSWLTSQSAAEAMAVEVAKWPKLYGCDGIDLDIENGAGEQAAAGPNMMFFIKKLRQLVPNMIISQPTYGYPQIAAETYIINNSWDSNGKYLNGVDSIGLMVYEGTQTLDWTKSYTNGPEQGHGVTCRAPSNTIILGSPGTISANDLQTLVTATMQNNFRGIMVWYASVKNGFQYGPGDDATTKSTSQDAYVKAMKILAP